MNLFFSRKQRVNQFPKQEISDYRDLLKDYGVLASSSHLPEELKHRLVVRYAYEERAAVAMAICSMPGNGDYFEFGSEGMGTFRNFLTAFDLNGLPQRLPNTHFYAFDIFGANDDSRHEAEYFKNWKNAAGEDKLRSAWSATKAHNILPHRCILKQGYFQDTLDSEFTASYIKEGRRIGTLFLDCNIASSYEFVFNWAAPLLHKRCFVYMDEFYITDGVQELFDNFCREVRDRYNARPAFVRNAGAFGALYLLM